MKNKLIMSLTMMFALVFTLAAATTALAAKPKATSKKSSATRSPSNSVTTDKSVRSATPSLTTSKSGAVAKAVRNQSESALVFQPNSGEQALEIKPNYSTQSVSTKVGGATRSSAFDSATTSVSAELKKGFTSNTSGSLRLGLASTKQDKVPDASGLTDFNFNLQTLKNWRAGQIFYGADLSYSPAESEASYRFETASSKGSRSGNQYSGGAALKPYIGFQKDLGSAVAGVKAQYANFFDRSSNSRAENGDSLSLSTSGGNWLSVEAFREASIQNYWLGAKIGFTMFQGSQVVARGNGTQATLDTGSTDGLSAGVYGQIPLKTMTLIPALNYSKTLRGTGGSASIEDLESNELSVTARMAL